MRIVAVTGTGTEVGKTIVTAALAACALAAGHRVAVVKPVQTGVEPEEPGDLATIHRLTGLGDLHEFHRYAEPLAPGTAARRKGESGPSAQAVADGIRMLADRDLVLVEGAGGALVHLNVHGETLLDALTGFDVRLLVVTPVALGALHNAAATYRALREHPSRIEPDSFVVGSWPPDPGLAERCNLADLARYTGSSLAGVVPAGAGSLTRMEFLRLAVGWLTPALGGTLDAQGFISANQAPPPSHLAPALQESGK